MSLNSCQYPAQGREFVEGLEFINVDRDVEWVDLKAVEGADSRSALGRTKTLSKCEITGDSTFILQFLGNYSSGNEPITHIFWEQCYLLSGQLYDRTLKKTFGAGDFTFRPPGMKHGPYDVPDDKECTMLVVIRYDRH